MTVYQAIEQMRKLSDKGETFSFTYKSWSRTRRKTKGIIEVTKAKLTPKKMTEDPEKEVIEKYFDYSDAKVKDFYQCCLLSFNGISLELT